MPFTISHAVLAPPLSKLSGGRLPIAVFHLRHGLAYIIQNIEITHAVFV
jgi:hypothetical protein